MQTTAPIAARALQKRATKAQGGTLVTFTTVRHPPAGFDPSPRTVGLIALDDGTKVMGRLILRDGIQPVINQRVEPRMRLDRVNADGLRIYDMAYEVCAEVPAPNAVPKQIFRGYIIALSGPSGVGKSTISRLFSHMASDYVENVPILTTRKRKKGDDEEYAYVSEEAFLARKDSGEIIAATEIPSRSETRWYGYQAADIEAIWHENKIPVVITERNLLEELAQHYGRRSILSFGLLPPGKSRRAMLSQLLHRLRSRGRDTEQQMEDRIKNAEQDLDFFETRKELFDHLIINEDLDTVIDVLKGHALSPERLSL